MSNDLLKAIAERAIKTFFQTLVAVIGTGALFDKSVAVPAFTTAASAAILSVFTSLSSIQFGKFGPSLSAEALAPTVVHGQDPLPKGNDPQDEVAG